MQQQQTGGGGGGGPAVEPCGLIRTFTVLVLVLVLMLLSEGPLPVCRWSIDV